MQSDVSIGVIGPNGLLGSELVKQGCIPLEGRLGDFDLAYEAASLSLDAIINCAAITDVDGCENTPALAAKVNTEGVQFISDNFNGHLIQISTDFVFDGRSGPYNECDTPSPISIYGWSKLGGELAARRHGLIGKPWSIIRTTTPFGVHPKKPTLLSKIIDTLRSGKSLVFPEKLTSSPSYIPHTARGIIEAAHKKETGVLNIAGSLVMGLGDFAKMVAYTWNLDEDLISIRKDEPPTVRGRAPRPLRGGLIITKAQEKDIFIGNPFEGLVAMKDERTL